MNKIERFLRDTVIVLLFIFGAIVLGTFVLSYIPTRPNVKAIAPATSTPAPSIAQPVVLKVVAPAPTTIPTAAPAKFDLQQDSVLKAYTSGLQAALVFYQQGGQIVNEYTTRAAIHPALMLNHTWQMGMALGFSELTLAAQAIRRLTPPTYLLAAHTDMLEMADHLDNAVSLWTQGFDKLNTVQIAAGTSEYRLATSAMQASTAKLDVFLANNQ